MTHVKAVVFGTCVSLLMLAPHLGTRGHATTEVTEGQGVPPKAADRNHLRHGLREGLLRRRRPPAQTLFTAGEPVRPNGHRFQNPCDGTRNARLKREDAFSHAMIIVSSAMVSSS